MQGLQAYKQFSTGEVFKIKGPWDNGKENGNYYNIIGYILRLYWG